MPNDCAIFVPRKTPREINSHRATAYKSQASLLFRYQVSGMGTNAKRSSKELNNSVSSAPVKPSTNKMKTENEGESNIVKI